MDDAVLEMMRQYRDDIVEIECMSDPVERANAERNLLGDIWCNAVCDDVTTYENIEDAYTYVYNEYVDEQSDGAGAA